MTRVKEMVGIKHLHRHSGGIKTTAVRQSNIGIRDNFHARLGDWRGLGRGLGEAWCRPPRSFLATTIKDCFTSSWMLDRR